MSDSLMHYGVSVMDDAPGVGSGRFPLGSGGKPYQRSELPFSERVNYLKNNGITNDEDIARALHMTTSALHERLYFEEKASIGSEKSTAEKVKELKAKGITREKDIADALGMSTNALRDRLSIEKRAKIAEQTEMAIRLKNEEGLTNREIGERLGGVGESQVRSLLKNQEKNIIDPNRNTADILKKLVDEKGYIDVGKGTELDLGVSKTRKDTAISLLLEEGYVKTAIQVEQLGTGNKTTVEVLAPPGTTYADVAKNPGAIHPVTEYYTPDDGKTFLGLEPPASVDPKRVEICYAEDGGENKDGLIEIRRGTNDLSLGESRYAQVRIAVNGTHYIKGMAVYSDDLPPGVDIRFNTNKSKDTPMLGSKDNSVLKPMKDDPDNPFGAAIKANGQSHYIDENGDRQLSPINKVNEQGDWEHWGRNLASQFLAKQPIPLARQQLDLTYKNKRAELEDIMALTNDTVKRKMLNDFADECDAASVHLKSAALPRQATCVLLPLKVKEKEIYAPAFRDGETVALVRYPHAGPFEIPVLTVNNKYNDGKKMIGTTSADAVGINHETATILSGADHDGDTAIVIPIDKLRINYADPLPGLKNFDPKKEYPGRPGMKVLKESNKGNEMGRITNLITDMQVQGATTQELERAVRHSMVVIDAAKHGLDYQRSYKENRIADLKRKYQGGENRGASTLLSRASATAYVPARKEEYHPDPETGKKRYKQTGETYTKKVVGKNGEVRYVTKPRLSEVPQMALHDDARELITGRGSVIEHVYADYANNMKAMANEARKAAYSTPTMKRNPSATKTYAKEVESLNYQLNIALKNAPRERQAQIIAGETVKTKMKANPGMSKEDKKKIRGQALTEARNRVGAHKRQIEISDREWEAIQAGAISDSKLKAILDNTDMDKVKKRATPKQGQYISPAKVEQIEAMGRRGYPLAEIVDSLGVSRSSVSNILAEAHIQGDEIDG